ncbi:MAG: transcriptional regulator [Candidatus Altiarchaeales archaeon ex4484_96]|nr:MAG: transcriptional regulator [Candidatus Altiarchaeales archaeon ex4484_96]
MDAKEKLRIFKALGNETRLFIIESLMAGEKCVCEIIPATGRKQCTVSLQLSKLMNLGVISSRREGKRVYYKISNPAVYKILNELNDFNPYTLKDGD